MAHSVRYTTHIYNNKAIYGVFEILYTPQQLRLSPFMDIFR